MRFIASEYNVMSSLNDSNENAYDQVTRVYSLSHLKDVREHQWLLYLCWKLLHNSPTVLSLIERNPFPDPLQPPRYIRMEHYRFVFSSHLLLPRLRIQQWMKNMMIFILTHTANSMVLWLCISLNEQIRVYEDGFAWGAVRTLVETTPPAKLSITGR